MEEIQKMGRLSPVFLLQDKVLFFFVSLAKFSQNFDLNKLTGTFYC
jgi:hypothetical protein